jgi:hypothetical protein
MILLTEFHLDIMGNLVNYLLQLGDRVLSTYSVRQCKLGFSLAGSPF